MIYVPLHAPRMRHGFYVGQMVYHEEKRKQGVVQSIDITHPDLISIQFNNQSKPGKFHYTKLTPGDRQLQIGSRVTYVGKNPMLNSNPGLGWMKGTVLLLDHMFPTRAESPRVLVVYGTADAFESKAEIPILELRWD